MFAIFEFGGKQYKATKGTTLKLEKIQEKNKETFFDKVLLVSDENNETIVGSPYVKGYAVHAKIIDTVKDKKVLIFKKKRRHNYRRKIGHRQTVTFVKIIDVIKTKSVEAVTGKIKTKSDSKVTKQKKSEITSSKGVENGS